MKLRTVNGSRFLAIPKEIAEDLNVGYMAVHLDPSGSLIYTPIITAKKNYDRQGYDGHSEGGEE